MAAKLPLQFMWAGGENGRGASSETPNHSNATMPPVSGASLQSSPVHAVGVRTGSTP